MEKFIVSDVFTPAKPARITFIDRENINQKLVNALQMPGKQIIVYGHSGSGKTTLVLNKLNQLYERHITTRCMKGLKFDQLILDAFDQLAPYYKAEVSSKDTKTLSVDISGSYLALQSKINQTESSETIKKESRILPPQLTPQALGKFLGQAKCCWILDDFHKIDESEKTQLSQLMKVFMDLSDDFGDLKIVALGAVDTARQVVDYDPEMRNRVSEIHVDLMTPEEIKNIIEKGEKVLNIEFGDEIKSLVANFSNGLASVCHHLCTYMCYSAGFHETLDVKVILNNDNFEEALKMYMEDSSDSIRSAFDRAIKQRRKTIYDNGNLVVEALSTFKERGASRVQILNKIRTKETKYPESNLKALLPKLSTEEYGGLVRYDQTAGLYSFSDPIYRAYALALYRKDNNNSQQLLTGNEGLNQLIKLFIREMNKNNKIEIKIHNKST